jgi:hypothetical protein
MRGRGRREGGEREERDVPVVQPRKTEMERKTEMGIIDFQPGCSNRFTSWRIATIFALRLK